MKALCNALVCVVLVIGLWGCPAKEEPNAAPSAPDTSQSKVPDLPAIPDVELANQQVEVGCAMCIFKMDGVQGCKLAAKVTGQPVLVSGSDVDAHTAGLCSKSMQATISGKVEDGKLAAADIELLPE